MRLFFDELAIGQSFASGSLTVSEADLRAFAARFDPQLAHLDPEAARASLFGGLVASGWHTGALTMRLLVESVPFADGLVGAGGEVTWPRPVRPDDTIRVESTITALRPSRFRPDRGVVTLRSETLNQHGEPVQILVATMIVPRRPAAG